MPTITGLTTDRALSRIHLQVDGEWTIRESVHLRCYRFGDGPVVDQAITIDRTGVPDTASPADSTLLVPNEAIVRLEADAVDGGWEWTRVLGVVADDDELNQRADALRVTSPPVHPSDEIVLDDGRKVLVPDLKRVEPFDLPEIGTMWPTYQHNRDLTRFRFEDYRSETVELRAFDGFPVRVRLHDPPDPDAVPLIAAAFRRLVAAGPERRASTTPHVLRFYWAVRDPISDEECLDYDIPLTLDEADVWDHVSLRPELEIEVNLGDSNPYLHPNSAYVIFEGDCAWDVEHGIQLSYLDGDRIIRVSGNDLHPTTAHAYARPDLLDDVTAELLGE